MRSRARAPQAMYEALTSAYRSIYRGSASPYSPDWHISDDSNPFGKYTSLSNLFVQAIEADRQFGE